MTQDELQTYIDDATKYLVERNRICEEQFQVGKYERFHEDQELESLIWTTSGVPKVAAKIQIVGTFSIKTDTWLWSWANSSILDNVKSKISQVKRFGEQHKIEKLITEKWPAEEVDAWEMTSIAAKILGAKGAYRTPSEHLFAFSVFTEIGWASSTTEYWPFDQPKNCAVISIRSIIKNGAPILRVTHDTDDHGWQFLELEAPRIEDGMVVAFDEIVNCDRSILQLADLPPGWHAWRRSVNDPWTREPEPHANETD